MKASRWARRSTSSTTATPTAPTILSDPPRGAGLPDRADRRRRRHGHRPRGRPPLGNALQQTTARRRPRRTWSSTRCACRSGTSPAQGVDLTKVRHVELRFGAAGTPRPGRCEVADVRFQEAADGVARRRPRRTVPTATARRRRRRCRRDRRRRPTPPRPAALCRHRRAEGVVRSLSATGGRSSVAGPGRRPGGRMRRRPASLRDQVAIDQAARCGSAGT